MTFSTTEKKTEEHADYINKACMGANSNEGVVGIYLGTEKDKFGVNYMIFRPSVVYSPAGEAKIEDILPTKIKSPLESLRPLYPSNLEEWVKLKNQNNLKRKVDEKSGPSQ